jgi:hypothetical protein
MSHSSRPLIRPGLFAYAQAFAQARADLVAMNLEHQTRACRRAARS